MLAAILMFKCQPRAEVEVAPSRQRRQQCRVAHAVPTFSREQPFRTAKIYGVVRRRGNASLLCSAAFFA